MLPLQSTQSGQWPLSFVQPIIMVKSTLPGEGGGCTPSPFHCIYRRVHRVAMATFWCTFHYDGKIRPLVRVEGARHPLSLSIAEYTEWQWPLSGVHSIKKKVKSAQLERMGGARPPVTVPSTKYTECTFTYIPS
jgi:hypothetical protein